MIKKRRITSLKNVETLEVSLVEAGANLKDRFPVRKSLGGTMDEILVEVLKADGQSDAVSKLEGILKMEMPEDAKNAIMAAMKLLEAYSDMMPVGEALNALRQASGEEPKEAMEEEAEKAEEDEEKKMRYEKEEEEELKKSLAKLPESAQAAIDAIWKSNQELSQKSEKLEKELGVEIAKRARREYMAKAENTLQNIPGHSIDEVVDLMIDIKARDEDLGARVEKALESASAALQGGPLLVEAGKNVPELGSSDPWEKIQAIAKTQVEQSGGKMTMPVAIAKTIQTNPELYAAYSQGRNTNGGR